MLLPVTPRLISKAIYKILLVLKISNAKMWLKLLCLLTLINFAKCENVIYHLNESEYRRMPAVIHRGELDGCARRCAVDAIVLPHSNGELYNIIVQYSARRESHYNHTRLRHGICVSKTCQYIITNSSVVQKESLEACFNETLRKDYGLGSKVMKHVCDGDEEVKYTVDNGDMVMIAIIVAFLIMNIIGSLQEILIRKDEHRNKFLSCFSVQRNTKVMFAERKLSDNETELKAVYGIRFLTMVLIVHGHLMVLLSVTDTGTHVMEKIYDYDKYIIEGTVIVHTFFVISAYLISHGLLRLAEIAPLKLSTIPIFVLKRWLRLTPSYLFMYGLTATLLRFAISSPLSQLLVGGNVSDCRRDWWLILLYLINYKQNSQCMIEAWFVATEFYLSILGVCVLVLWQGKKRIVCLSILFCAGLLSSGVHTYMWDLDGTILPSPENFVNYMADNLTFNTVYKWTHTNISSYVVGISTALIINRLKEKSSVHIGLRLYFLLIIPLGLALVFAGSIFFMEGSRLSVYVRTAWAVIHKPFFTIGIGTGLIAQHFRLGGLLNILRWKLWIAPARLGYCVYLVNLFVIRLFVALFTTVPYNSELEMYAYLTILHMVCYVFAIVLWLLVEAPSVNLTKLLMDKIIGKKQGKVQKKNIQITVINTT